MAEFRAVYSEPFGVKVKAVGNSKVTIPNGVGRCVRVSDGAQDPIYIVFGAASVNATPADQRIDFGQSQYIIPDGATTMSLQGTTDRDVLISWGFTEGNRAGPADTVPEPAPVPLALVDDLASILDPPPHDDPPPSTGTVS